MNKKRLLVCLGALLVLGVLAALSVPYGKKIMQERQEAKEAAEAKQIFTKFHPLLKSLQSAAIKLAETRGTDDERRFTFDDLKVPLPPGIMDDMRFASYTILGQDGEEPVIYIDNSYIAITLPQEDGFPGTGVFYFFKNDRYFSFPPGSIVCYGGDQRACPEGTGMVGKIGDYMKAGENGEFGCLSFPSGALCPS